MFIIHHCMNINFLLIPNIVFVDFSYLDLNISYFSLLIMHVSQSTVKHIRKFLYNPILNQKKNVHTQTYGNNIKSIFDPKPKLKEIGTIFKFSF